MTRRKKDWSIGKIVKVGSIELKIIDILAIDGLLHELYTLVSEETGLTYTYMAYYGLQQTKYTITNFDVKANTKDNQFNTQEK